MKPSLPLKAIFFDIDDTLFSTTEFAQSARRNAIEAMIRTGLRVPADLALQELNEIIAEFSSNHDRHFDKLIQRLPANASSGINPAILVASGVIGYHQTKFSGIRPYQDTAPILDALSRTSILLGVITAGLAVKQAEKLLRLDLDRFFHPQAIFISDQIGISKPNRKLFLKACESMGFDPAEAMYIGNDPVMDIDPANRAGMVTVHVLRDSPRTKQKGQTQPDYTISDFHEIPEILRNDFGIHVAP
jgi:putative hydrolase of the HAD superfamily